MENWKAFAFLSMFFAGWTSVIAKFGLKEVSSEAGLFVRTMFVALFVSAICLPAFLRESDRVLHPKTLGWFALSALTTSGSWYFYYKAVKEGRVSTVSAIDKASLAVGIFLSFLLLKEPLSIKLLAGTSLILVGTYLVSL